MKITKNFALVVLILFVVSCNQNTRPEKELTSVTDNLELQAIYDADQGDRLNGEIDWSKVGPRDEERQKRVTVLLDSNLVITAKDNYNAAMVFQHGNDTVASAMAVKLMRKAIELDSSINKWLLAAAIDRDLMRRKEPQIYGTQYVKLGADEPWKLYDIDTTQITDEERIAYRVETLAQQRAKVKKMNLKKLSVLFNDKQDITPIIAMIQKSDLKQSDYDLSEDGINTFGYELMGMNKNEEALKIFKLNTEMYPEGFNTFDSYGECLLKVGKKEEGLAAYKKSLELNPDNTNAKEILADMEE